MTALRGLRSMRGCVASVLFSGRALYYFFALEKIKYIKN